MRKFITYILMAVFAFSISIMNVGCSNKQVNESTSSVEAATYIYKQKEYVVKNRQYCMQGDVYFPDELWEQPTVEYISGYDRYNGSVKAYYLKSVPNQGEATDVFAYVGIPNGATKDNPVPGIVLVHGGGGTAFPDWVRSWMDNGYAAIAIDTEGNVPPKDVTMHSAVNCAQTSLRNHGPNNTHYADSSKAIEEQFLYHAVAATIVANSFLGSFEEVDENQIGLTGISWGGVIATNVACYDDRFAFCAPIYGAMAMKGTGGSFGTMYNNNPRAAELWDNHNLLSDCRTPMLFVNWNADPFFAINATSACVTTAQQAEMVLIDSLGHGHGVGANIAEILVFANSVLRRSKVALPQFATYPSFENPTFTFDGVDLKNIRITLYTTKEEKLSPDTAWESTTLPVNSATLHLDLGSDVKAFYVTIERKDFRSTCPVVKR